MVRRRFAVNTPPVFRAALAAFCLVGAAGCKHDTVVAPRLEATCSASPSSGAAPLAVAFSLNVTGADGPFTVVAAYGDGSSGAAPDRPHTFEAAGIYPVAFTVSTASQSARCAVTVTVTVAPVVPVPIENTPPHPVYKSTPPADANDRIAGKAPLSVRFAMCDSSDVDRDVLRWTMDFQGDGTNEVDGTTGGACRHDFTYAVGTYRPKICVTDLGPDGRTLHPFQCKTFQVTVTP
jgi:PKD domain-containing protein